MNTVKDFRLPRKLASIYRRECNEECRDYNVVQENKREDIKQRISAPSFCMNL